VRFLDRGLPFESKWKRRGGGRAELTTAAERYFKALKEGKITGYLFPQQNYIPKEE